MKILGTKSIRRLAITRIITALLLFVASTVNAKTVVEVVRDNQLAERRYYEKERLIALTMFNAEAAGYMPIDSLCLFYDSSGQFSKLIGYDYDNKVYRASDKPVEEKYYRDLLFLKPDCLNVFDLRSSYLIMQELNDICYIENAMTADLTYVRELKKEYRVNDIDVWEFARLNSVFKDLSLGLQSFFCGSVLSGLKVYIKKGFLVKEVYVFEGGNLTRSYEYNGGNIETVSIKVRYKNGQTKSTITRYYFR